MLLTAQSAHAHINVKIAIITCFTVLCIPLNVVKMLDTVNEICSGNVDLNLLLHGGQTLDYCQNKTIIESVELYILETKRLL